MLSDNEHRKLVRETALRLAADGFRVFPCHSISDGRCTCHDAKCKSPGKHPRTLSGCKEASSDPSKIEAWFGDSAPLSNLAIATGDGSGCWVLDIDAGSDGAAEKIIADLEARFGALPLPNVATGGGGNHRYFALNGEAVPQKAKVSGVPIDTRSTGGYVIVPPSRHIDGDYEWREPLSRPLPKAPAWLIGFVRTGKVAADANAAPAPAPAPAPATALSFVVAASLADHPGVREGSRHDVALRLIGQELAAGTAIEKVAELAVVFANRCTPPMDTDEALRLVSDLSRMRAAQAESKLDEVEAIPLPPSLWPSIETEAYHGLAGETVRAIEPHSEADPAALLIQTLCMFGNVIGRSAYFPVEGSRHCCNLFCCIVGATSRGRKGTGGDRAKSLFAFADPNWTNDRVQSGLVSGEGLIYHVRDAAFGTDKNTGEPILIDEGVHDKRLLVVESEFATVLKAAKRETNTLSPTLRAAWDGGTLRTLAKNSACKATGAHVSIAAHITSEELAKTLAEVEIFAGLGNRFLWVAAKRSKLLPSGGGNLDLTSYAERLAKSIQAASRIERMRRSDAAERLWARLYEEYASSSATGLVAAVTSRAEAQTLRLSMIYALLDGSDIIDDEHLKAAAAVWRYCEATAVMLFRASTGATLDDKLLAMIRESPGVNRRDLHRRLGNNSAADVLAAALARLRDGGHIRIESAQGGRGRPAERYYPADGISSLVRTPNLESAPAAEGISSLVRNENLESDYEEGEL